MADGPTESVFFATNITFSYLAFLFVRANLHMISTDGPAYHFNRSGPEIGEWPNQGRFQMISLWFMPYVMAIPLDLWGCTLLNPAMTFSA
ncbi:MAG: hypothetical protein L3J36_10255 [Rhodobacteraceae bacterium]|nr:hypothetical protein [Paracoccaceae bacterium]